MSEQKIFEGKFQWPTKGERISGIIIAVVTAFFLLLTFAEPSAISLPLSFGAFGFTYYFLGSRIRRSTFADVYPDRVEFGATFFRTKMHRIEASKIESVIFSQSVLGKSNYGNVSIGGSGGMKLRIQNIIDPEAFVSAVKSISSAPIQKNAPAASGSAAKEIAELNELLKAGVISQEDFDKGKNKALGL